MTRPWLEDLVQCGAGSASSASRASRAGPEAPPFDMPILSRSREWAILMIIGVACGAPLDDQRIYFPGESPDADLESRSYGLQPNLRPDQMQQSYQQWGQHGAQQVPGGDEAIIPAQYEGQRLYNSGYGSQVQDSQQYQPAEWAAGQQYDSVGGKSPLESLPYGAYDSELHHGARYSGSTNNGVVQSGRKTTKHTWTSRYSSSGAGQMHQGPHQVMPHQASQGETQLGHTLNSSGHQASSQDLASILDGASHQGVELHPSIKQAFDNVIKDFGGGEPSKHAVHKISHTKKTTVQNVGKEPSHIQSTAGNDDINLSQLIEQLQMLEQSPRHVNITWCEEKIKEFLRALRRKQASGVYINQHVQEETLHQVLTHESVEGADLGDGIHEPIFTKVTVRPLGGEDFNKHKQESQQVKEVEIKAQSQEEASHQEQPEIITVVPQEAPSQPEVMSHQHEQPQAPPFTSDSDDLKQLELELPEYVPFEHAHLSMDASESEDHSETRPHSSPGHVLDGHQTVHHETSVEENHHTVYGRPEAPQPELGGSQETHQEEKATHTLGGEEQMSGLEKSSLKETFGADGSQTLVTNASQSAHHVSSHGYIQTLHKQQINYDTLIEELIQLESIPGHQAIDKCEEKIQEFLEILKYQQEQGFGRNQQELESLHKTLIEQAQERSKQLTNADETTLPQTSFWRRVQNKIRNTYDTAKGKAREVIG